MVVCQLFELIEIVEKFDIFVIVVGGGVSGQVGVICYGIICVLIEYDEILCSLLCKVGYVICDVCEVECKKVGLCKVCKCLQYFKC